MSILISDGLGGLVTSSGGASPPTTPTPIIINPFVSASGKEPKALTSPARDAVATPLINYTTIDYATSAFVEVI